MALNVVPLLLPAYHECVAQCLLVYTILKLTDEAGRAVSFSVCCCMAKAARSGGKDVTTRDELTDSGAGSASKMANPEGDNAKVGTAIRTLVNSAAKPGVNAVLVTHKTNIADAFGKDFADVGEG